MNIISKNYLPHTLLSSFNEVYDPTAFASNSQSTSEDYYSQAKEGKMMLISSGCHQKKINFAMHHDSFYRIYRGNDSVLKYGIVEYKINNLSGVTLELFDLLLNNEHPSVNIYESSPYLLKILDLTISHLVDIPPVPQKEMYCCQNHVRSYFYFFLLKA